MAAAGRCRATAQTGRRRHAKQSTTTRALTLHARRGPMTTAILHVATGDRERTAIIDPSGSYTYRPPGHRRVARGERARRSNGKPWQERASPTLLRPAMGPRSFTKASGARAELPCRSPSPPAGGTRLRHSRRFRRIVVSDTPLRARLGSLPTESGVRLMRSRTCSRARRPCPTPASARPLRR